MSDDAVDKSLIQRFSPREQLAVIGLLSLFLLLAAVRAFDHPFPWYDDVAYLDLGNHVRELGGPLSLVRDLFAGTYPEDNRHPLYLALLSLVAGRDPGFHVRAEGMAMGLGAMALLACWWVVRRRVGPTAALITLGLLAVSETMVAYSSKEACEPLLIALWALAIDRILEGNTRPRAWLAAGAFAGLAFLCKGSGIFLPIVFVIALVLERRWSAWRSPHAWGLLATFALVASPLLVRNVRLYHAPFHQSNSRFFWIDRLPDFAETFAPHAMDRLPNGPREYLAHTTLRAVLERIGMGIGETLVHLGDAMSLVAPRPFGAVHIALIGIGLAAALFALRLLWRAPPSWTRTVLLVQAGWFYLFFAFFNANGGASRYLVPMTISLVAVLAHRLAKELEGGHRWSLRGWPGRTLALAALAVVMALALDPSTRRPPPGFAATQRFLVEHLHPGDVYAVDARTLLQPRWLLPIGVKQEIVSAAWQERPVPEAELIAWLRDKHVRYLVLDATAHNDSGDAPRYFFYDRLKLLPDGSLPASGFPDGLHPVYVDGDRPRRWMVLAFDLPPA